jgi:pyruvate/2-oxoglutarate dehydrogenase complex dihydrolipoamide acyltransferase (E2) component
MTILSEIIAPKSNADDVVLVRRLYFSNGDKVKKQDELIDLETSKTAIILDSPVDGYIEYCTSTGESVGVGEVIIKIHKSKKSASESIKLEKSKTNSSNANYDNKIISNAALKHIKKNNFDLSKLNTNFVTLENVNGPMSDGDTHSFVKSSRDTTGTISSEISLAKINEIKALSSVQSAGIVSTIFISIDVNGPVRGYSSSMFNGTDSLLPLIIFESSRLLRKYPVLNAYFDNGVIRTYENVNIGLALDIDDGLKVYTIQDSDSLSLSSLESSISQGVDDYLDKKLKPEQLAGSTFTITDLSSFEVNGIIPLVNYNQSAILGISSIDKKLNRVSLSLSFDHRVTEGKVVSQFLVDLKSRVESHASIYFTEESATQGIRCDLCLKSLSEDREMQSVGLIKIINHDGSEGVICRTCLEGWT